MKETEKFVNYEAFGAIGDGTTDDFAAIKAAHDYANENGLTVVGTPGKTYLIHDITDNEGNAQCVSIRTDTVWKDVNFIIDDRGYYHKDKNNTIIFKVESDYPVLDVTDEETINKIFAGINITSGFKGKINWSDYGYEALILVKNANHKNYIRAGGNADSGQIQSELIVVDENGQIREDTPFLFAYDSVTRLVIYRVDTRKIKIEGGKFTHIANDIPQTKETWGYFSRSVRVFRSNTTVDGLEHYVEGELPGLRLAGNTEPKGAPYSGFLSAVCCTDVNFSNCILTARRSSGLAGTYDFQAGSVNNLYLYNVNQSNYYEADGKTPTMDYDHYWGIGGTNYCKNLTYDNCDLSRYDAHCGLYNGKVINSTVCNMELIGGGDMLIENTVFTTISFTPIMIRPDYGCTWRGTITVKDCTVRTPKKPITTFLSQSYSNHDFGYTCTAPNVIIDNLTWDTPEKNEILVTGYNKPEFVTEKTLADGTENKNVFAAPKFFKVINNNDGTVYKMYKTPLYKDTEIEGVTLTDLPEN